MSQEDPTAPGHALEDRVCSGEMLRRTERETEAQGKERSCPQLLSRSVAGLGTAPCPWSPVGYRPLPHPSSEPLLVPHVTLTSHTSCCTWLLCTLPSAPGPCHTTCLAMKGLNPLARLRGPREPGGYQALAGIDSSRVLELGGEARKAARGSALGGEVGMNERTARQTDCLEDMRDQPSCCCLQPKASIEPSLALTVPRVHKASSLSSFAYQGRYEGESTCPVPSCEKVLGTPALAWK